MESGWAWRAAAVLAALTLWAPPVSASAEATTPWPAPCVETVAREARLSRSLLQAIVWVESRGEPWALNVNMGKSGWPIRPASEPEARRWIAWLLARGHNVDLGLMQINSRHLGRLRLSAERLLDPCVNLRAGARLLNELIARHGETWRAIMRYNGSNPAYARRVQAAWAAFRRIERAEGRR
jgi:soluble lytic murein transglycosylase-like protein